MICRIRTCAKCLRILSPTSGDDCPNHTLPCCGGKGAFHEPRCMDDPAYLAGQEEAKERARRFWAAFL